MTDKSLQPISSEDLAAQSKAELERLWAQLEAFGRRIDGMPPKQIQAELAKYERGIAAILKKEGATTTKTPVRSPSPTARVSPTVSSLAATVASEPAPAPDSTSEPVPSAEPTSKCHGATVAERKPIRLALAERVPDPVRDPLDVRPAPRECGGSRTEGVAMADAAGGTGTADDPWRLTTPSGTSEYTMHRDESSNPPSIVCQVGKTQLRYDARCLDDLHAMLKEHGDWMPLGSADEQKDAAPGTVEAWGRSESNPVGGWYGLKKGLRGRFGMYIPPLMERLRLAEVEHNPRNNRMRPL